MEGNALVRVENLQKYFPVGGKKAYAKALDGISFEIYRGETLGLVGESGCGKTTAGRAILRLISVTGGKIWYDDQDITTLKEKQLRPLRHKMQVIFQDPYGCLNPRKTVCELIGEPLKLYSNEDKNTRKKHVIQLMEEVGLRADYVNRFPHEFSGGQRQRIGIARALAMDPEFIVCDEPVSALDVSVQAQVVNLIRHLQKERGLTYLFISHDLRIVKHLCDRIAVMYLGAIVEIGNKTDIYDQPAHPYTQALLSAIPEVGKSGLKKRILLTGEIPSPICMPAGCRFHTRCPHATERCKTEEPTMQDLGNGHFSACHYIVQNGAV